VLITGSGMGSSSSFGCPLVTFTVTAFITYDQLRIFKDTVIIFVMLWWMVEVTNVEYDVYSHFTLWDFIIIFIEFGYSARILFSWVRASWINLNNCPRCDLFSLLHICRQLYMFRVLTSIIRSSYNCNYSLWHWSIGTATGLWDASIFSLVYK